MSKTVSAATLGDFLGVSERRVKQLRAAGVLPGAAGEPYELRACVRAYCGHLRPASGRAASGGASNLTLNGARIELLAEQTKKLRLENDTEAGLLLPADAVRSAITRACLEVRNGLLALPSKLSPTLARLRSPNEVHARLTGEIIAALTALSQINLHQTVAPSPPAEAPGVPDEPAEP
jgi:phage terminase Nu1 subunit (DNA packaging protein)